MIYGKSEYKTIKSVYRYLRYVTPFRFRCSMNPLKAYTISFRKYETLYFESYTVHDNGFKYPNIYPSLRYARKSKPLPRLSLFRDNEYYTFKTGDNYVY